MILIRVEIERNLLIGRIEENLLLNHQFKPCIHFSMKCLFELADLWVPSLEAHQYVDFMRSTIEAITSVQPATGEILKTDPTMTMPNAGESGGEVKMWMKKGLLGGRQVQRIHICAGFDWCKTVGPKLAKDGVQPEWCPATHFGYQTQGTCKIKFEDGTETTINAGDSYLVDKPHLPEIIGDETVIMHEFSQQVKKVLDSMKD
mgnify:CR=1 FL=1